MTAGLPRLIVTALIAGIGVSQLIFTVTEGLAERPACAGVADG